MAPDLKLDPVSWDLDLSGGGPALTDDASGETVAQAVGVRLKLILGEWFLDGRLGVDYFGTAFVKNPNLGAVEAMLKAAIVDTPGVARIANFAQAFDRSARSLTVLTTIFTDAGQTVTVQQQVP